MAPPTSRDQEKKSEIEKLEIKVMKLTRALENAKKAMRMAMTSAQQWEETAKMYLGIIEEQEKELNLLRGKADPNFFDFAHGPCNSPIAMSISSPAPFINEDNLATVEQTTSPLPVVDMAQVSNEFKNLSLLWPNFSAESLNSVNWKLADAVLQQNIWSMTLPRNEVLNSSSSPKLRREDFLQLRPASGESDGWLGDDLVDAVIKDLIEKTCADATYLHPWQAALMLSNMDAVVECIERETLESEILIVPVCERSHWNLYVVWFQEKRIIFYDSIAYRKNQNFLKVDEFMTRCLKRHKMEPIEFRHFDAKELPKQENGSDCGVFLLCYIKCLLYNKELNFFGIKTDKVRKLIALEFAADVFKSTANGSNSGADNDKNEVQSKSSHTTAIADENEPRD